MQMDEGDARSLRPVTGRIIGCAFRAANALGHGFIEEVSDVSADQLRPVQSRNPPHHRLSLIAKAIPFIPAYPASSALKKKPVNAGRHCADDFEPERSCMGDKGL